VTQLHVGNRSTLVTDAQVESMVHAIEIQLQRDVAPAWGVAPVPVKFAGRRPRPKAGDWVITVIDDPDTSGDAGWHTEKRGGIVFGRVFARPCLKYLSQNPLRSVSSTLSHEAVETLLDPNCSYWADSRQGHLVAREACDPVEDGMYRIGKVSVSNFVYPAYFDPDAMAGVRLDHMKVLQRPFTLTKGGYTMERRGTKTTQRDGETFPIWKKKIKKAPGSRPVRRRRAIPAV
jgi:hypothetical protein